MDNNELNTEVPAVDLPEETKVDEPLPEQTTETPEIPVSSPMDAEMPSTLPEENCVMIGDQKVEIKPTKVKYFRNKMASAYNLLKIVPLIEFLQYKQGVLDPKRSGDQLLFDFLIAVFDDSTFVTDNYDQMSTETIEQIVNIFGRINHIVEKEEAARKNKEAQAKH